MEAGEIAFDCSPENTIGASYSLANHPAVLFDSPRFEPISPSPSSSKKRKDEANNQNAQEKDTTTSGVSNCYIFKSQLQEYCQKVGLMTPVYETIKAGPSHKPSFKSTVIVNNVRYDSLDGFFNRKVAEQSAAEVALVTIANSDDTKPGISQPVQETGLCKNLLQEYAQKMNYAIPLYECYKNEKQGYMPPTYSCAVEIGPIKYIGASANTKKEAEIKAARTAMLAIRSSSATLDDPTENNSIYTVVPQKKKAADVGISTEETKKAPKRKKRRSKQQSRGFKKKKNNSINNSDQCTIGSEAKTGSRDELGWSC